MTHRRMGCMGAHCNAPCSASHSLIYLHKDSIFANVERKMLQTGSPVTEMMFFTLETTRWRCSTKYMPLPPVSKEVLILKEYITKLKFYSICHVNFGNWLQPMVH